MAMANVLTMRLVGLAAFCSTASIRVCDAMLIALGREFGVSTGDASQVVSAFGIAYGLMLLVYGPLGDRFGKLRVIAAATFACALFSAVTAMAQDFDQLVLARVAMAVAAAGIVPLSIAWVGDQVAYAQRQEALARLLGANLTGMMVGQWLGGFAAGHLGWRSAFIALASLFLLAAALLYRNIPKTDGPPPAADGISAVVPLSLPAYARDLARLLALRRVRWVLAVTTIEAALVGGALAFMPSHLVASYGFSMAGAGGVMVLYGGGGLLYSQLAGRWLALLGEKGLALGGGVLVSVGLLVLASASVPWLGMLACVLAGMGFYMLHGTLQIQATQMAPESRGTAVALFASVLFMGQALGVLVMAYCADRGRLTWAMAAAALAIVLLGAWVSRGVKGRGVAVG